MAGSKYHKQWGGAAVGAEGEHLFLTCHLSGVVPPSTEKTEIKKSTSHT